MTKLDIGDVELCSKITSLGSSVQCLFNEWIHCSHHFTSL